MAAACLVLVPLKAQPCIGVAFWPARRRPCKLALPGPRERPVPLINWCREDTRTDRGLRVVITGSSRELGLSLARQFVSLGDAVVISGRSPAALEAATAALRAEFPGCRVLGVPADASQAADVERLADAAVAELGGIDIWVCNAGQSQQVKRLLAKGAPSELQRIVDTNLLGALLGARAAIARMQRQQSGGKVFFVDGNGRGVEGNGRYVRYLTLPELLRRHATALQRKGRFIPES